MHGTQSFKSNTLASKYCANTANCIVVLHNTFKAYGHDYRGITVEISSITAVTPQGDSIPAVLPQVSPAKPRYFRGYRGITAIPITVKVSSENATLLIANIITSKEFLLLIGI